MKRLLVLAIAVVLGCSSSTGGSGADASNDAGQDTTLPPAGPDDDGDGLANEAEAVVGTDPKNPDSDDDGVLDGKEFELGSHPLKSDSDGDGVDDGKEVAAGTDPAHADTDGDGFSDGAEAAAGTDPLDRFSWTYATSEWPDMRGHADGVYSSGWDVGDIIPNTEFIDQFGQPVSLYQFYSNVVLLDFSAGWCIPCRKTAETAQAQWSTYRDKGFIIIHLLTENVTPGAATTLELQQEWAETYGISFPVVRQTPNTAYDAITVRDIYVGSLPFLILLDRGMKIDSGYGGGQEEKINTRIEALLAQSVDPPVMQGGPGAAALATICDQDGDGQQNTSCGGDDCNDSDAGISPAAVEQCDAVDHNCDELIHVGAPTSPLMFLDADGDGYGDGGNSATSCGVNWPYVTNADDCDDTNAKLSPETVWYVDADKDGSGDPTKTTTSCTQPEGYVNNGQDIDDNDSTVAGCWKSVVVGRYHSCGLRLNGTIACWGSNNLGVSNAPEGNDFVEVSSGYQHNCALRNDGTVTCWGQNKIGSTVPPKDVTFTTIACGLGYCCGLTGATGDNVMCWGDDNEGQSTPPAGTFLSVSASGGRHTCGVDTENNVICWGSPDGFQGGPSPTAVPAGKYIQVSAGHYMTCAVTDANNGVCWGANKHKQGTPAPGTYTFIDAGTVHSCGLKSDETIACWGSDSFDRTASPPGTFTQLDVDQLHSCAVSKSGLISCWGLNDVEQLVPALCVAEETTTPGPPAR